jgi:hypothetical protein
LAIRLHFRFVDFAAAEYFAPGIRQHGAYLRLRLPILAKKSKFPAMSVGGGNPVRKSRKSSQTA